jgi:hypothetical protein
MPVSTEMFAKVSKLTTAGTSYTAGMAAVRGLPATAETLATA